MSKVKIQGHASGTGVFTLTSPNSSTDRTITLPDGSGTLAFTTGDDDKLPLAGGTMTGNLIFADNVRARFGASNDLQIFHDTNNSYIENTGTGDLIIQDSGGDVRIKGKSNEDSIVANNDGSVDLYHDNTKKFETTATGVNIIASTSRRLSTSTSGEDLILTSFHQTNNRLREFQMAGYILKFFTGSNGADTSTTEKMRINSNGNVGIATTDASRRLTLDSQTSTTSLGGTAEVLKIAGSRTDENYCGIGFHYDNSAGQTHSPAFIGYKSKNMTGSSNGEIVIATRSATTDSAPIERMTITAAGNVGIGTTSPTEKLHLATDSKIKIHSGGASGNFTIQNGSGTTKMQLAGGDASQNFNFDLASNTNSYFTFSTNNGTERFRVDNAGVDVTGICAATSFSGAGVIDTVTTTDPAITTNPSAVGHIWLNKTTGNIFTCTRNVSNENIWINSTDPGRHVMFKKSNGTADLFGDNSDLIHLTMSERLATSGVLRDYSDKNTASVDANVQFSRNSKFSHHSASFHGNGEIRIPFMSGAFTRSSAFTVSLWITRKGDVADGQLPFCINGNSSTTGRGVMVSGNNIFRVSTTAPNTMHGSLGASFTVNDGDHFIVIGYSDATSRLYKNGSIVGTTPAATNGHSNVSGAAGGTFGGIGNVYNPTGYDGHNYFNCSINNIRIFNKAVSATEAATLYAEGY